MSHFIHSLPNGLVVVGEPMPEKGAAAWTFLVPAGSATEPRGLDGLTGVLESTSYRGAGNRNARELSDALDDLGIDRGGGADIEYTTFGGATLGLYLPEALALYADILRRPHLSDGEWQPQRELALQALKGLEDSPSRQLFVELRRQYFGSGHGRSTLGTRDGLSALSLDDLRADHAARFRPNGAILSLAGAFDENQIKALVDELFGDWSGTSPTLEAPQIVDEPLWQHIESDKAQTHIGVAHRGVSADDPDNYNFRLANAILSGGMGARLFTEVREKRGLVYSVSTSAGTHRGIGYTFAHAGTTPERAQQTLEVLLAELRRMSEGVAQDELDRARIKMLTSLVMSEESSRARAATLVRDVWMLGRVRSTEELTAQINAVTPSSIREFYERHPPENFSVITLGPQPLERV